jgi:redox-sensing transcriptional repressor
LPIYLRALARLLQEDQEITSSHELGLRLGISSAQIRKDLSHFGEFGKQGTGYNVAALISELKKILNVNHEWQVALVGIGDLGTALVHYGGFSNRGFKISHLFDRDPEKIGQVVQSLIIQTSENIEAILRRDQIQIAMITTPADEAQSVANALVSAGIHSILNYAPIVISVPAMVRVQYIDPVIHLQRMAYYLE